ncbi:MAG: hypothetical protein ABI193_05080 [Minicystis sp.]
MQRFATLGEGELEWVQGSRADYRLLIAGYGILIELHADDRIIEVWYVARRRG